MSPLRPSVITLRLTLSSHASDGRDASVLASIGTVGDCYDNALAESLVDSFKTELIADRVWRARAQLELPVVEYVAGSTTFACTPRSVTARPPNTNTNTPRRSPLSVKRCCTPFSTESGDRRGIAAQSFGRLNAEQTVGCRRRLGDRHRR